MANQSSSVVGTRAAARYLGIHPDSLRRAERAGRVPQARREPVSRYRIYTPADLESLAVVLGRRAKVAQP